MGIIETNHCGDFIKIVGPRHDQFLGLVDASPGNRFGYRVTGDLFKNRTQVAGAAQSHIGQLLQFEFRIGEVFADVVFGPNDVLLGQALVFAGQDFLAPSIG
jgi:hypothetical protein